MAAGGGQKCAIFLSALAPSGGGEIAGRATDHRNAAATWPDDTLRIILAAFKRDAVFSLLLPTVPDITGTMR